MGQAERIKKTVFPTAYRLFLHFFIYIFVVMLSNTLTETDGIFEIPMVMLITAPFFLLEKTAYYLQDPFENRPTDIALTSIARSIDVNLRQLIDQGDEATVAPNDSHFYVM
jgi:putative membrane protein